MKRSNMFANIENKFEFATKDEIVNTALSSISDFLTELDQIGLNDDETKLGIMVIGAKLGVSGDGIINNQEKMLIDNVFGRIIKGSLNNIYDMIDSSITEADYDLIATVIQAGNQIAIPLLYYILSFAYIDGKIEDKVAERLDSIFGMSLLVDFIQSGAEEVPAPQIRLTGFEAEIVSWFKQNDTLHPLDEIQAHFYTKSKNEVKKTLDSLVDKGILYGGDNIIYCMYGLA